MSEMIKKTIISAIFITYVFLGNLLHGFLFGHAFFMETTSELLTFFMFYLLLGIVGAFVLSTIPILIWAKRKWIWLIAYPFIFYFDVYYTITITLFESNYSA